MKKRLKYIFIVLLFVGIAGYTYYQSKGLTTGPVLIVDYPINGMTLENSNLIVQGTIKNASYVTMNGRQIFVDETGKFQEIILLSLGYNVIEIELRDKFERIKKEKLEVVYKPSEE